MPSHITPNITLPLMPPNEGMRAANAPAAHKSDAGSSAPAATAAQRMHRPGANALRQSLLSKLRKGQDGGRRADTTRTLVDDALTACIDAGSMAGQLASALLRGDLHAGPDGHTVDDEKKLFADFQRAGFSDADKEKAQALSLLHAAFGTQDKDQLASRVATAATRLGASLTSLAEKAIDLGIIPKDRRVGMSTIGDELRMFRTSVGFH